MKKGEVKKSKHYRIPKYLRYLGIFVLILFVLYELMALITYSPQRAQSLGITFSDQQAEFLGLDWHKAYLTLLDELKIRYVRLPIYWEDVEPIQANYDFKDLDWQLQEAAKRGVKVTLVLGARQPRWPECHFPAWISKLTPGQYRDALFSLLTLEAQRYGMYDSVDSLQVENEPLLDVFGECPKSDANLLRQEVDLVRTISPKPIVLTGSGELAPWYYESKWSDILGSTLYRITWSRYFGYQNYWMLPASLYRVKAFLFGHDISKFWISELQMEPWFPGGKIDIPLAEQYRSMSPAQLVKNLDYAYRTNVPRIYLWGAEWWLYTKEILKTDAIWNVVKTFNWK